MGWHICQHCNSSTDPTGRFCSWCGARIEPITERPSFPEKLHRFEIMSGAPYGSSGDKVESYIIYVAERDANAFSNFLFDERQNNYRTQWFDQGRVE
jgi:hypothetical protein